MNLISYALEATISS